MNIVCCTVELNSIWVRQPESLISIGMCYSKEIQSGYECNTSKSIHQVLPTLCAAQANRPLAGHNGHTPCVFG